MNGTHTLGALYAVHSRSRGRTETGLERARAANASVRSASLDCRVEWCALSKNALAAAAAAPGAKNA